MPTKMPQSVLMIIKKEYQENSLLLFQGTLTVNLISILGNHLRLLLNHDFKGLQKIFKIFIELAQNVSYYSADTFEVNSGLYCGAGWISVQEMGNHYRVTTGNLIKPEDGPILIRYCEEINSLPEEDLRKLKREIRSEAMVRDTGAHIGLIQISILSGNKLDYSVTGESDSNPVFILATRINKELT
jgi:hypothetical protein